MVAFQVRQEKSSKTSLIEEGHEYSCLRFACFLVGKKDFSNKKNTTNGEIHQSSTKKNTRNLHLPTPPTVSIPNPPIHPFTYLQSSTSHHGTHPRFSTNLPEVEGWNVGSYGFTSVKLVQKSHSQAPWEDVVLQTLVNNGDKRDINWYLSDF